MQTGFNVVLCLPVKDLQKALGLKLTDLQIILYIVCVLNECLKGSKFFKVGHGCHSYKCIIKCKVKPSAVKREIYIMEKETQQRLFSHSLV